MDRLMKSVLVTSILAIIVSLCIVACDPPASPAKFQVGQTVTISQTGEKTVVIERYDWRWGWEYRCRVASPTQQHRDGLLARDTEITRYSLITFKEFELKE